MILWLWFPVISGNKAGAGKRPSSGNWAVFLNTATSERLEYDHVAAFSEKLEWARRLERIEGVKAEERMKSGKPLDPSHNYDKGRTDDVVAKESGFGSREKYRKAKFIAENADSETIAKLDADEISIHRAWKETKARLEAAQRRYVPFFFCTGTMAQI